MTWPFADARNTAVFTTRRVFRERVPICLVTHDDDDGSWQFLCGTTSEREDPMVVALEEIVDLDPTIVELADLPMGWRAYRSGRNDPWKRAKRSGLTES